MPKKKHPNIRESSRIRLFGYAPGNGVASVALELAIDETRAASEDRSK